MRIIRAPIYAVKPYERGIQETLGRYTGFVMPGLGFQIPYIQLVRVRDIRERTLDIPPRPVITKDNIEIQVDGIMWVRPASDQESVKRTFYNIVNWKQALTQLAVTMLRRGFADLTLDESLVAQEKVSATLLSILSASAEEWGVDVDRVEIRLIDPPKYPRQKTHEQREVAMPQQVEAETAQLVDELWQEAWLSMFHIDEQDQDDLPDQAPL